jgi:hypothetical protein
MHAVTTTIRFCYRASVDITHDLTGKQIPPIRISAPLLKTYNSKEETRGLATDYLRTLLFEVYVRVVSHVRRIRFLPEPYAGCEVDAMLAASPGASVVDYTLPDTLIQAYYNWNRSIREIVETVCTVSHIDYIDTDLIRNADSRSSDSSDSQ